MAVPGGGGAGRRGGCVAGVVGFGRWGAYNPVGSYDHLHRSDNPYGKAYTFYLLHEPCERALQRVFLR